MIRREVMIGEQIFAPIKGEGKMSGLQNTAREIALLFCDIGHDLTRRPGSDSVYEHFRFVDRMRLRLFFGEQAQGAFDRLVGTNRIPVGESRSYVWDTVSEVRDKIIKLRH